MTKPPAPAVRLGLRENLGQFALLVLVNAFVVGMVGLERTVMPLLGSEEFGLVLRSAIFLVHRLLRDREGLLEPCLRVPC